MPSANLAPMRSDAYKSSHNDRLDDIHMHNLRVASNRQAGAVIKCSCVPQVPGQQRKKKSFFAKLFGKDRTQEHDSFAHFAPPETLEADDAPTIVILNSLNHDQLLELLKVTMLLLSCLLHTSSVPGLHSSESTIIPDGT